MIVKNVKLEWVSVKAVNDLSGKYSTDFYFQDKDAEKAIIEQIAGDWAEYKGSYKEEPQSLGWTKKEDGTIKFKATQAPQSADGKYTFTVGVYDAKARKLTDIPSIGNGTIAHLDIDIFPYTFKNKKGVKLTLKNIQILKLEEGSGSVDFEPEEGYTKDPGNTFQSEDGVDI